MHRANIILVITIVFSLVNSLAQVNNSSSVGAINKSINLDRTILFTGCSNSNPSTDNSSSWIRIDEGTTSFCISASTEVKVKLPFRFQSNTPSQMGLDWRILIDDAVACTHISSYNLTYAPKVHKTLCFKIRDIDI
jgi:hypothetical protein